MKKCVDAVVWGLLSFGLVSLPIAPVGAAGQAVVQGASDYENHQYKADIDWALKNRIMGKFPDGFKPDEPVTQAHFLGAFANLYKLKEATPMPEMGNHWAKGIYEKAKKAGWLEGIKIDPGKQMTREDGAQIFLNVWKGNYEVNDYPGKLKLNYTQKVMKMGFLMTKNRSHYFDRPFTRAYTANFTKVIFDQIAGMLEGERLAEEFHKSLKISGGKLTGNVPKFDYRKTPYVEIRYYYKDGSWDMFSRSGQKFGIDTKGLEKINIDIVSVISTNLACYNYFDFKTLKRVKVPVYI